MPIDHIDLQRGQVTNAAVRYALLHQNQWWVPLNSWVSFVVAASRFAGSSSGPGEAREIHLDFSGADDVLDGTVRVCDMEDDWRRNVVGFLWKGSELMCEGVAMVPMMELEVPSFDDVGDRHWMDFFLELCDDRDVRARWFEKLPLIVELQRLSGPVPLVDADVKDSVGEPGS